MSKRTMARNNEVEIIQNPEYSNTYTWWIPPDNAPVNLFPVDKIAGTVVANILAVEDTGQLTSGSAYTIRFDPVGKLPHLNLDCRLFYGQSGGPLIREKIFTSDHTVPYSGGSTSYQILFDTFGFPSSGSHGPISDWQRRP